jgi:receptor expression-enhancing protein 5/6
MLKILLSFGPCFVVILFVFRPYIAGVLLVFFLTYMLFAKWSPTFCTIVGFLYPLCMSVVSLEDPSPQAECADPCRYWLTYWVVYAAFCLGEAALMPLLQFVPYYWFLRCMFVFCLFAPLPYNGSQYFYHVHLAQMYHRLF